MRRVCILVLSLALSGCGEADHTDEQTIVATRTEAGVQPWLSPTDAMDPAVWLASREAGRLLPDTDARTDRLRQSVARVRKGFIEDPRMIANRTVQLAKMLAEAGRPEGYADLIDGLGGVARAGLRKQLYGEMCQHYYNTRRQGADHEAALVKLTERSAMQVDGKEQP